MNLIEKLDEINRQKNDYITPNNIRKNITVLNITGNLEGDAYTNLILEQENIINQIELELDNIGIAGNLPNMTRFNGSICTTIPNFDISDMTIMIRMFNNCKYIKTVPNFNTSNITSMYGMCFGCFNLIDMPQYNTSKVTDLTNSFYMCNNLSNASIQNIVNMCLNSSITNTTLKNLSNYNSYSPLYSTIFDNSYYSNRLDELTIAGWTY